MKCSNCISMIASLVGLLNLIGLLILPQVSAAAADRHLLWSVSESVCDTATLDRVQLFNANLNIQTCFTTEYLWDPDALLVFIGTSTTGTYLSPSGDEVFDVQDNLAAFYAPTQGACQGVDRCLLPDTLELLPQQYTYDCSNVYCGEHAIRDCGGNYQSVACPQGRNDLEIPTYAKVTCEGVLTRLSETDRAACNPTSCQLDPLLGIDLTTWSFTCQPSSSNESSEVANDNRCLEATVSRLFGEWFQHSRVCNTDESGNEFCLTLSFGPLKMENNEFWVPRLHHGFGCTAEYNGQTCDSCMPCGEPGATGRLEAGESFSTDVDCSNIQADSRLNGCDQTATGVLEFFYKEGGDLACPLLVTTDSSTGPGDTSGGDIPGANAGDGGGGGATPGANTTDDGSTSAAARGAAASFVKTAAAFVGVYAVTSFLKNTLN